MTIIIAILLLLLLLLLSSLFLLTSYFNGDLYPINNPHGFFFNATSENGETSRHSLQDIYQLQVDKVMQLYETMLTRLLGSRPWWEADLNGIVKWDEHGDIHVFFSPTKELDWNRDIMRIQLGYNLTNLRWGLVVAVGNNIWSVDMGFKLVSSKI